MSSDLVSRLRMERVSAPEDHPVHPTICDEAAERIEQLTALIEQLTALIEQMRKAAKETDLLIVQLAIKRGVIQ